LQDLFKVAKNASVITLNLCFIQYYLSMRKLLLFFLLLMILASCQHSNNVVSGHFIQKRKYRNGFHIEHFFKPSKRPVSSKNTELVATDLIKPETENADSISIKSNSTEEKDIIVSVDTMLYEPNLNHQTTNNSALPKPFKNLIRLRKPEVTLSVHQLLTRKKTNDDLKKSKWWKFEVLSQCFGLVSVSLSSFIGLLAGISMLNLFFDLTWLLSLVAFVTINFWLLVLISTIFSLISISFGLIYYFKTKENSTGVQLGLAGIYIYFAIWMVLGILAILWLFLALMGAFS